ncbi:MAG TPA: glycosyltransferase family 2 protein [Gaiellaceae bacterium]|jgi:hypothetical protein|nr:glycosyltransferase family 2 protein [Gaiellaceae bacterium]
MASPGGRVGGGLVSRILDCGEDRSNPFPGAVPVRRTDSLVWSAEVWRARLTRRYPGMMPVFRRHARAWRRSGAGPGPSTVSGRDRAVILGVAYVWNEEDVIWATVQNLFAEGADEVFVFDDGSLDDTRAEATMAGATVIGTDRASFSETARVELERRLVSEQTALHGNDVWWVLVDADEFPRGPDGTTIRTCVESLPPWVDVVGSRVLEHQPSDVSFYRPRTHPAASIPLARWRSDAYCPVGHWKHQLFRVRTAQDLLPMPGSHTVASADGRRLREAGPSLLMHHVPLRERAATETRLRLGLEGRVRHEPHMAAKLEQRLEMLDDLYAGRFDRLPNHFFPGQRRSGLSFRDWRELVPEPERALPQF